jgi:hypothetical protein
VFVRKNLLELYALATCFAAVLFLLVSMAWSSYSFVRIGAPSVTLSGYTYERGQSDEQFMQSWPSGRPVPSPSEIPRLRQEALNIAIRSERHDGFSDLLLWLMFASAAAVAFWFHWRLALQARENGRITATS